MQFNMQVEGTSNGGSEQASNSDDGQFLVALRKIMKKEMEVMVIRTVKQVIVPIIGDLVRKVVKEEIQSVEKRLLTGGTRIHANEMTISEERNLQLKFLDEVSDTVLTGEVLKGKGRDSMMVALVDRATGEVVNCGPESSAKVEVVVLDASDDDNELNWTHEHFNNRIIREGDKKKPHFAKSIYIYLKNGVGILSNAKLGHDSSWMKRCKCRLGARIMENFRGINVQEARTESFTVLDRRSRLYENHDLPSLSDEVWRLKNIGRDGDPCKRLIKENIRTVQDFLFLHSVDPQRLRRIVGARSDKMWNATLDHAWRCTVDDKKMYLYYPSAESRMGVIFDAVGGLKGVINESHYVPIDNLSAAEKDCAHKLLLCAFENRKDKTFFDDEASLLQRFPYRSSDIDASTDSSAEEGSNGNNLSISENVDGYPPTDRDTEQLDDANLSVSIPFQSCQLSDLEDINQSAPSDPGTSSQSISPCIRRSDHPNNIYHFGSVESTDTGQLYESMSMDMLLQLSWQSPDLENINAYSPIDPGTSSQIISPSLGTFGLPDNSCHFGSVGSPNMGQLSETHLGVRIPSCQSSCPASVLESSGDNWSLMHLANSMINHQQSNVQACSLVGQVVNAMLLVVRAKKKFMALRGIHVRKRQRI